MTQKGRDSVSPVERAKGMLRRIYATARACANGSGAQGPGSHPLSRLAGNGDGCRSEGRYVRQGHTAGRLRCDDLDALMAALPQARVTPVSTLHQKDPARVGVRVDLSGGVTRNSLLLLEYMESLSLPHCAALSLMKAGDLCVVSEGRARVDPGLHSLLASLGTSSSRELCCLNELADVFLLALGDPWVILEDVAAQLEGLGLRLSGYATAIDASPATQLNLLLLHGGYFGGVPDVVFDMFGVHATELQGLAAKRERLAHDFDFVKSLTIEAAPAAPPVWNGRVRRYVDVRYRIAANRSLAWMVRSDWNGWRIETSSGAERDVLSTADLLAWLPGGAEGRGLIVLDPAHVVMTEGGVFPSGSTQATMLRALPYPYQHYLAFNSDIDWSTHNQHAAVLDRLNRDLGLPVASSFYLRSTSRHWVAAKRLPPTGDHDDDGVDGWVAAGFGRGAIDTLHGIQNSLHVVVFEKIDETRWQPTVAGHPVYVEGFLVASRTDLQGVELALSTQSTGAAVKLRASRSSASSDDRGLLYAYFPVPNELRVRLSRSTTCGFSLDPRGRSPEIVHVTANDCDPESVMADLRAIARDHVRPLLFTSHGGGANVLAIANLHSSEGAADSTQEAMHDIDNEHSPYFMLPNLMEVGVRFFNPIGLFATPELTSIERLTQATALKNGTPSIFFARFISTRHEHLGLPSSWGYGKTVSHAAALGFQIADIIQRLHWKPSGHGGVLYTHFGHNVGNQVCERLAWTEETHAAFERVARYYHPDFAEAATAFRLWVAPASSVLLYSWIAKRAANFISVKGSSVQLTSWHDEALAVDVPDVPRFGTKFLHGITVYVESAKQADVTIGDNSLVSFTRNPADETGRESITIVDDSSPQSVLVGANVREVLETGCTFTFLQQGQDWAHEGVAITALDTSAEIEFEIFPVALAAATHWSLEISGNVDDLEIGFRDARGILYLAGRGQGEKAGLDQVVWDMEERREGTWSTATYSLTGRRPHPDGPPCRSITSLVVRTRSAEKMRTVSLRRVALLRPQPCLIEAKGERVVAGRVRADSPLDPDKAAVVLESGSGRWTATIDRSGRYRFDAVPAGRVLQCSLERAGLRHTSERGRAVVTTCDHWDWNFQVP